MIKLLILVFFSLCIISCSLKQSHYKEKFGEWEELADEHPEAVMDSLKTIRPENLSEEDEAHYYLLQAYATDKTMGFLSSDSTILIAEKYYASRQDFYNLSRARFYLAEYVYIRKNNPQEAYTLLKQAEVDFSKGKRKNYHTIGLIYYWLGQIQHNQANYPEAEEYYNKSIGIFRENGDTLPYVAISNQLGLLYIKAKEYGKAGDILSSIQTSIEAADNGKDKRITLLNASVSNTLSFLHQQTSDKESALHYAKKSIQTLENKGFNVLSAYYYQLIDIYRKEGNVDSCKFYCTKMQLAAQKENNIKNLLNSYRLAFQIEESQGNYKESCRIRDEFNKLKDDYNRKNKSEDFIELERKYNLAEKERASLKIVNRSLWFAILSLSIALVASGTGIYFRRRHRLLKIKNAKLTEEVNKKQWAFALAKELIGDNSSAYEELEKLLTRNITIIPSRLYDDFQQTFRNQKNEYTKRLFSALTNIDSNFIEKLQKICPDLTAEDMMLASMLRHQWNTNDIARVFRITFEALKKRKYRLKLKLMANDKRITNMDEYLKNL